MQALTAFELKKLFLASTLGKGLLRGSCPNFWAYTLFATTLEATTLKLGEALGREQALGCGGASSYSFGFFFLLFCSRN